MNAAAAVRLAIAPAREASLELAPCVGLFPAMTDQEFQSLKESIRENGQREPIIVYQGKVVDGRNRLRACQELGIAPKTREWDGRGSLVKLVVDLNSNRRHLTQSQRNAIGVGVSKMFQAEMKAQQKAGGGDKKSETVRANGKSVLLKSAEPINAPRAVDLAAHAVRGSASEITKGIAVEKSDPKLLQDVVAGKVTLNQASRTVKRAQKLVEMKAKSDAAWARIPDEAKHLKTMPWEIITGDCLEVLPSIAEKTVRLVFADPPYNINLDYGPHHDDDMSPEDYLAWCKRWMQLVHGRLTDDGSFFLLVNWEWAHDLAVAAKDLGFHKRQTLVWHETFGENCTTKYNRTSRALFWFTKSADSFVWNPGDWNTRESDRQKKYHDKRADPDGKLWDDVWGVNPPIPRLVDNAVERVPGFPTQVPEALLKPIVCAHSDPGDLVMDPFAGSGTTGAACENNDRKFVGIEMSAKWAKLARQRLKLIEEVRSDVR